MTDHEIKLEAAEDHGRYVMPLDDGAEGEMTWRRLDADTIAIDHTEIPVSHRGHGLARKLVERGIADARAAGIRIVPVCPYVAAEFRRHPDWADVLAERGA